MKFLLSFLLGSFLLVSNGWTTNWEEARSTAASSGKLILLNFSGSDWCGPCIRMHKEIFEDSQFTSFADKNLVLVKADFPRLKKNRLSEDLTKQNEALAEQYNPTGKFPFTVLIDAKGKVLRSWEGYPKLTAQSFVSEINGLTHAGH